MGAYWQYFHNIIMKILVIMRSSTCCFLWSEALAETCRTKSLIEYYFPIWLQEIPIPHNNRLLYSDFVCRNDKRIQTCSFRCSKKMMSIRTLWNFDHLLHGPKNFFFIIYTRSSIYLLPDEDNPVFFLSDLFCNMNCSF